MAGKYEIGKDASATENQLDIKLRGENRSDAIGDDQAAPREQHRSSKPQDRISDFLKHPLALLLVGAVLSSYLIPSWTRQWQNQQTELNTKVEILDLVDRSITQMIMSVQYAVNGSPSQSQSDYSNAYRQWQIDTQIIYSKLKAYFPHSPVVQDWKKLSQKLDEFYFRSGIYDPAERKIYLDSWLELREDLIITKDKLNQRILDARIDVFR